MPGRMTREARWSREQTEYPLHHEVGFSAKSGQTERSVSNAPVSPVVQPRTHDKRQFYTAQQHNTDLPLTSSKHPQACVRLTRGLASKYV